MGKALVGTSRDCLVAALVVALIAASFAVAVDEPTLEMGSTVVRSHIEDFAENPVRTH